MSGLRWAEKLRQFNEEHSSQVKESQQGDDELLEEYYTQFKDRAEDKKYDLIPKFYSKPPTDDQVLQQKLREEARYDIKCLVVVILLAMYITLNVANSVPGSVHLQFYCRQYPLFDI